MVPECEGAVGSDFSNSTLEALLPETTCHRYSPAANLTGPGACDRDNYHPEDTVPCDQFLYENNDTIYAEVLKNLTTIRTKPEF